MNPFKAILQLEAEIIFLKKRVWQLENPMKFEIGEEVRFFNSEHQINGIVVDRFVSKGVFHTFYNAYKIFGDNELWTIQEYEVFKKDK